MQSLVTTAQLADLLGVDRSTITRRVQLGKLQPAFKGPGRTGVVLFDVAAMDIPVEADE